jgi:tRNA nucleotidyltransferase (CCA-adding enzyme)
MPNGPKVGSGGSLSPRGDWRAPSDSEARSGWRSCAATSPEGGSVDLRPPSEVRWIVRTLEEAGFSTWAVGGAVRDALAGRRPGDWDLATAAKPRDVQRLFRRTVPVGIEHGTVGVLGRDRVLYEITTFRRDVETFGRHATVAFADTLDEDLERRDFTINAVAWHPLSHRIHDPHHGAADLAAGVLRTVGDAAERFREDRLRVLRALRFAGRFGLRIDPATWEAMRAAVPSLPELSAERIREELFKVLAEMERPSVSLGLYERSGALGVLYPELQDCVAVTDDHGETVWEHTLRVVDAAPRHRLRLRVAALLHDTGKPATERRDGDSVRFPEHPGAGAAAAREVLRRLKASNADIDHAVHLIAHHSPAPRPDATDAEVRQWLRVVGRAWVPDLLRLRIADARARGRAGEAKCRAALHLARRARDILRTRPPLEIGDLAIDGADLRRLGLRPGPRFGEILRHLLDRVVDDPTVNTPERLQRIVREEL